MTNFLGNYFGQSFFSLVVAFLLLFSSTPQGIRIVSRTSSPEAATDLCHIVIEVKPFVQKLRSVFTRLCMNDSLSPFLSTYICNKQNNSDKHILSRNE